MGDYWTVTSGVANHTGHTCRECRGTIYVNTPIFVRDGRKIRLFYHAGCFSGDSDPRTQPQSSILKWEGGLSSKAPPVKGYGKWWTSSYGYEGGLQNGRALPPSTIGRTTASTSQQHDQAASTAIPEKLRGRSPSLTMISRALKDGVTRRLSSSSSSESATEALGFGKRYSLLENLSKNDVMTKDAEDRSMTNAEVQIRSVGKGQSSTAAPVKGEPSSPDYWTQIPGKII